MKTPLSSMALAALLSVGVANANAADHYGVSVRMFGWAQSTEDYAFAYPAFSVTNLLKRLLDAAHSRFGVVHHINCHSMNAVSGAMGEGGAGVARADFVLGDRDGSTCAPEITAFVREHLATLGYDVRVNDPFKGVELVRAYADPASGRHSLQIEINKRLYMHANEVRKHAGFERLQAQLMGLLQALQRQFPPAR